LFFNVNIELLFASGWFSLVIFKDDSKTELSGKNQGINKPIIITGHNGLRPNKTFPSKITSLQGSGSFACQTESEPAMTSTFTDLSLLRPTIPSLIPSSFSKFTTHRPLKLRCSLTEDSTTFIPFKLNGEAQSSAGHSATADCVIVGGGISGLCIAQALATKHWDVAPNVIVTEARDRVGGNITTLERDGYLWEEGPNSFQPSDPMLTMVVRSSINLSFYFILF
jgi:oxygen-dependent protoporphyrinogen oxidase